MESVKDPNAPAIEGVEHADEAQWALTTARTLQDRGDTDEAVTWYRRAVDHLMASGNDELALDVARLAASLSSAPPPPPRGTTGASALASSGHARVTTQPSQVPASFTALKTASPVIIETDEPSASGEVNAAGSLELLTALRRAVSFQPTRVSEGEQLAARLSHMALFREVAGEMIRAVARQVNVVGFDQGELMLTHAYTGPDSPLYVLLEGRGVLRANGEAGPGTPLGSGDFIGEISTLYGGPGLLSATAREAVIAAAIPRSLACWLAREVPTIRVALEDVAWERAFGAIGRGAPMLRKLSPDQRGLAYSRFEPVLLNPGDLLVGEGAPPLALWIIAAGEVEVYGGGLNGRQPIRARAGDVIGLRSILGNEPSGVSARTLGTVLAAKVGVNGFRVLIDKHPKLAEALDDIGLPGRAVVC